MIWLFIYVLAISLYDLRTRCIPNWYTLPLIFAGMVAHFPGHMEIWLASLVLVFAWGSGAMGAGDAKLWLALLWALPLEYTLNAVPLMFLSLLLTSLFQFLWRVIRKQPLVEQKTPAAWRTIPFLILCWYAH
jgi:Flp pilus assembly protein protease CpaA